jgi:hypothetical protein
LLYPWICSYARGVEWSGVDPWSGVEWSPPVMCEGSVTWHVTSTLYPWICLYASGVAWSGVDPWSGVEWSGVDSSCVMAP